MKKMIRNALRLLRQDAGVVGIEYGLLAMFIALALTAGAGALGSSISIVFLDIGNCFDAGVGGNCPLPLPDLATL